MGSDVPEDEGADRIRTGVSPLSGVSDGNPPDRRAGEERTWHYGLDRVSATGSISPLPMSDEEKAAAASRAARRPPLGFRPPDYPIEGSLIVKVLAVVLAAVAALAVSAFAGAQLFRLAPQPPSPPGKTYATTIWAETRCEEGGATVPEALPGCTHPVAYGVPCVVYQTRAGAGLSCDWSRLAPMKKDPPAFARGG